MKRARPTASSLALCLALAVSLCVTSRGVVAQVKGDTPPAPSAELKEVRNLNKQIVALSEARRYAEAVPLAQRALSLAEAAPDANKIDLADAVIRLAMLYVAKGDYAPAEPLYRRGVALREQGAGPDHHLVGNALNGLAELYRMRGEYARAEPVLLRALAVWEKSLGPGHASVATATHNLARLYFLKGDYARVEALYRRSLAVHEQLLGPEHSDVAAILGSLASLYYLKGEYARAEPLYERSLAIHQKVFGPGNTNVAVAFNNLAGLYQAKGDYERARPLYERALAIYEKVHGPAHPSVGTLLNNLASNHADAGDDELAEPLYRRALAVYEKALGPAHPDVANALTNLASLYANSNDARAEPLYHRALAVYEKALGPAHVRVAGVLHNLADLYKNEGEYERAEPLYRRALAVRETALGPAHFDVAKSLGSLSALGEARGRVGEAVRLKVRAEEVRERNISLILSTGSERQKLAYLATLSDPTNAAVSLHARTSPADPAALGLALTTILRRKGRALDAMADQVSALRRRLNPQDKALLDRLSAAQSELSARALGGGGDAPPQAHREAVARLEAEVEGLQDSIGRRSAEFGAQSRPVTIEQVRRALPAGAAVVEFFSYKPFDAKAKTRSERFGPPRYVAYVLRRTGAPRWADIGEAAAVDADLSRLLKALKCPENQTRNQAGKCPTIAEVKLVARAVDERVMRPVRRLLGAARQVFIAPDAALNLLPFGALVDEDNRYLVETLSLTYLTSGRDLLRLRAAGVSRQPPVVIADPLFGAARPAAEASRGEGVRRDEGADSSRRSAGMGQTYFGRLAGTAEEARALGTILPRAEILTQADATESALKRLAAPSVLHVATHGFFLPDQSPPESGEETRGLGLGDRPRAVRGENPLLRSGLALADANGRQSAGGNDGILTALEAAGLDLWGTRLVVLSACETGVGEVRNGEGVYGLRRALVLAGSETQVMSLWQVSDAATRDLMIGYYRRLTAGEGRAEALRQIQLRMLRRGAVGGGPQRSLFGETKVVRADLRHPYYWAAFIQSGDWRGMAGAGKRP